MTVDTIEMSHEPSEPVRILLSGDGNGSWTVSWQDSNARQFSDFDVALDSARQLPGSQTATIEVWQSGEYICCLSSERWRHREARAHAAAPITPARRAVTAAGGHANRTARGLMALLARSVGWH